MSNLSGLKGVKNTADVLQPGEHVVRVLSANDTNSFMDHKGAVAEKDRAWADPTPQVLVQFGNDKGVFMHRLNLKGYKKFDECTDKEIEQHKLVNGGGYACKEDKDGDLIRIEDKSKTQACIDIAQDMLYKFGGEDATEEEIIAEKALATMKLVKDESAEGNGRTIVKYFRAYSEEDAIEALEEASAEGME